MALVRSSPPAIQLPDPARDLEAAVGEFRSVLTEDQRTRLQAVRAVPDAQDVLVFTAQLDYLSRRKGRSIGSRLHSVLASVREFSAIIDVFVSSHPEIAALVWGSVKLAVQV